MFTLEGKKALITGASGGIGQAIASALYQQGASVVLTGTREAVLKEQAEKLGERASYLTANMSNIEEVEALIEQADSPDILICNAGITRDNLALRMKLEDVEDVLDINLKAPFILNKAALKKMVRKKWGRIINITSLVGVTGNPGQANYAASKAGMIGMSKSLAAESARRGITVNCVAPGFIATPMTDVLPDAQKDGLKETIPVGAFGKPEDIASAVVFLASEEASYVTGQTIHVNGGLAMI